MQKIIKKLALCLAITLALSACGEKNKAAGSSKETKTNQNGKIDKGQDSGCEPGKFGPDCKPCTCTEHGSCNDGKDGDGKCRDCDSGFYGENCQKECACEDNDQHFCDDGPEGFGCICEDNFVGDDCDIPIKCNSQHGELDPSNGHCKKDSCQEGWQGEDCDTEVKCVHGEIDPNNDHCKKDSCQTGWIGEYCEKEVLCQHGMLDTQTGHCLNDTCILNSSGIDCKCMGHWIGANCDVCNGRYGANCDKEYGSVTDVDGNTYKTVIINDKEWMAESYKRKTGTWYYPDANSDHMSTYGLLYDWDTAASSNFCPTGWHLPSIEEYSDYLLTNNTQSQNLRAITWANGTNISGFTALPAGMYSTANNFGDRYRNFGQEAYFWTTTTYNNSHAYFLRITKGDASTLSQANFKTDGLSVRCLKD